MKHVDGAENLLDKAADMFDLPEEVVAGAPRVTVTGCRRVLIENHRGMVLYGEEEIRVGGGRIEIVIGGKGLTLRSMSDTEMLITGEVSNVGFIRRGTR